ncbi:MAG: DNA repair protein RecN [Gammaproteobacteria bacterium]|nr:DNA repair protein RecN [Gammaproteobacteria bacterium]
MAYSTPKETVPACPISGAVAVLKALNIRNFALVAELDIEFGDGLTVITGESGAGKSILLDALSLVLGARARRAAIRPGTSGCDVSAEFDIDSRPPVRDRLVALDMLLASDETTCLVRRHAGENRSRSFVNGIPATLAALQSITGPLVDVHGQDEHRLLLARDVQRRLLDEFGVDPKLVSATAECFRERSTAKQQLDECRAEVARAREHKSLVSYQIDELTALGDSIDRFDELTATYKRLTRARELIGTIGGATTELDEELITRTSRLAALLDGTDDPHPNLRTAVDLATAAHTHLEEILGELRRYLDSFPEDDRELGEVDAELAALHDVSRKHRVPAGDLGAHLANLQEELASLAVNENRLADLATRAEKADAKFLGAAESLSTARRSAAATFSTSVTERFAELGLADASIDVEFFDAESAAGLEAVEFKVATNPKYPAGALAEIASGGELARISLAIEVVAAERSRLPCLILDEADIGVGGVAADVLGRMLKRLSKNTQVIAITHAPQIAALGDAHLRVEKTTDQDTAVRVLTDDERLEELARMLGGRTVTGATRDYARTLLAEAEDPVEGAVGREPLLSPDTASG